LEDLHVAQSRNVRTGIVVVLAFAVLAFFSWHAVTLAQPGGGSIKLAGGSKDSKGAFESILAANGNKSMLLAVQVRVAGPKVDSVEHLGRLVQSTDSFLVIKLQNQQDLVFVPWEHILWIVARPSA
jgi:hypothetical protein